ncbi:DUF3231 family protein [Bacillus sp. Marseille-P3661]|uniref:DUF3231 family protein n=1 Tax=Bacillus sp. Marseille-P3661 TaxID=1936234 RepID=UPI000C8171A6|nr:DUF3231 family protein [Bacillus sp. Marseille-P3661]
MGNDTKVKLTSAELSTLWSTYMSDSAAICIVSHFLKTVEDVEIKPEIEFALNVSKSHLETIAHIFNRENYALPIAFSEELDVYINAPRLFSDSFYLYFLLNMGAGGLANYSMALTMSTRKDVIDFFSQAIEQSVQIKKRITNVMLNKGIYIKAPYLDYKDKPSFVEKESFFSGWFGKRRTLISQELAHLYINSFNSDLSKAILIAFSQVASTPEIRDYFIKGHELSRTFIEELDSVLTESSVPSPRTWDTEIMKTTDPPYSEKLMMFLVGAISAIGIANLGGSLSLTLRHDLGLLYTNMVRKIGSYAEDGASLMINNGWFERPPQCINRRELANDK